jgi:hypothetical protein
VIDRFVCPTCRQEGAVCDVRAFCITGLCPRFAFVLCPWGWRDADAPIWCSE